MSGSAARGRRWWSVTGLLFVFVPLLIPIYTLGTLESRDPSDEKRARIECCYDRFGREPPRKITVETSSTSRIQTNESVFTAGRRDLHSVLVDEWFLERASDDALAVALAQSDYRARELFPALHRLHEGLVFLALCIPACLLYLLLREFYDPLAASFLNIGLLASPFVVVALAFLVAKRCRRITFEADQFASETLGADTVEETYERFGDSLTTYTETLREKRARVPIKGLMITEPRLEQRLKVLED